MVGWVVYILRCHDGTLYTGITTDPVRRLAEHQAGRGSRYTRGRRPLVLLYQENHPNRASAARQELALKKQSRADKLKLIAAQGCNPATKP
jgi:predicted GIY-YIG superfamily endonuclease